MVLSVQRSSIAEAHIRHTTPAGRLTAGLLAVVLAGATTLLVLSREPANPTVKASSTTSGTDPQRLLDVTPGETRLDSPAWASVGEPVGTWLDLTWPQPTQVDRVRLTPFDDARAPRAVLLEFDDGSSLLVTARSDGELDQEFPARPTRTLRITVADAPSEDQGVALSALAVDDTGSRVGRLTPSTPSTGEASSGLVAEAAVDGGVGGGDGVAGGEWRPAPSDIAPWLGTRWSRPVEVASVQVLGPGAPAERQPPPATAPALSGVLRFDDGSQVVVSGIDAGPDAQPTTIAFAPRVVGAVQLLLTGGVEAPAVREFRVFGPGTTPPRSPVTGATYAARPPAAGCDATADSTPLPTAPAPGSSPVLLCPAPGSTATGPTTIVVGASPGTVLEATAPVVERRSAGPRVRTVDTTTTRPDGRAVLTVDTADLPDGPVTVQVRSSGEDEPVLPVQLLVRGGRPVASTGYAPPGMTEQWGEEFDGPLPVTMTGAGSLYAAGKPTAAGSESFGEAYFADPADGAGTVSTVDGHLRLRIAPAGPPPGPGEPQIHQSGMISSLRVGAGGFAAQYGYFEARMTGAPGRGSWPAFWTLNSGSAVGRDPVSGEADAVELYGHDPEGSCHTVHTYDPALPTGEEGDGRCLEDRLEDWTRTWHTYGMRIVPDGAQFYVDGVQVAEASGLARHEEPFYFMVDLALGGGWPVDLSSTGETTDLYVDWVRVWT